MTKKTTKDKVVKWFTIILITVFLIVTFASFITLLGWHSSKKDKGSSINATQTVSSDGISN